MPSGYKIAIVAAASVVTALAGSAAYAATTADSTLSQSITTGTISTNFTNTSGAEVLSPSFGMTSATVSTTGDVTTTGTYGSDSQRATVNKPGIAGGFTLTVAAQNAAIGWYENGTPAVSAYLHNGASASEGQLTVSSGGTLGQYTGSSTGISGATGGTFTGTTPITIMSGSAAMDEVWRGYVYGIGLSQVIPSGVPAGTYSIDLVQTVTSV